MKTITPQRSMRRIDSVLRYSATLLKQQNLFGIYIWLEVVNTSNLLRLIGRQYWQEPVKFYHDTLLPPKNLHL
jgi:hypothetical protein